MINYEIKLKKNHNQGRGYTGELKYVQVIKI